MARRRGSKNVSLVLWCSLVTLALLLGLPVARAEAQDVQGCQPSQYLDRTAPSADRDLAWDFGIGTNPERCVQVQVGQTVVWHVDSDFDTHPLGGQGGDAGNPISFHNNGSVTFNAVGTFGFQCLSHSSMKGAIKVVSAALPQAVPALPPWLAVIMPVLLLGSGLVMIRNGRKRGAAVS